MSRNLTTADIEGIKALISTERLSTFVALTGSDEDAVELHQATMRLGSALLASMATVEIALRNSISRQLTEDLKTPDWLQSPPQSVRWSSIETKNINTAVSSARRATYAKLSNTEKTDLDKIAFPDDRIPPGWGHARIAQERQKILIVSTGQITAQLTFFFWKRLFSENYEQTLWKRSLKKVFPNKTLGRSDISTVLETLYQARNRLAHHEPIYGKRLDETVDAIDFVKDNLGERTPNPESVVAKFIMPHREDLDAQIAIFRSVWARLVDKP